MGTFSVGHVTQEKGALQWVSESANPRCLTQGLARGLEGTQGCGRARGSQADPAPASLGFPRLAENSLTRSNRPKIEKLTLGKRQGPKSVPRQSCCSRSPREPVRLPPSPGSLNPPRKQLRAWHLHGSGAWTGLASLCVSSRLSSSVSLASGMKPEAERAAWPRPDPLQELPAPSGRDRRSPAVGLLWEVGVAGNWGRLVLSRAEEVGCGCSG